MRHLQKQQVGQLFQIIAIAHAVIAQGVAEVPDFLDEGGGVHMRRIFVTSSICRFGCARILASRTRITACGDSCNSMEEFMVERKSPSQRFGGDWTQQKLDILRKYLSAYTTVLSKTPLKFAYIDAFAGTGYRVPPKAQATSNLDLIDPIDEEGLEFLDGSARLALETVPPFQKLIFIEKSAVKLDELKRLIRTEFADRESQVQYRVGDANAELNKLCSLNWRHHRAVLFLDPFGMQVEWKTIETIAGTQAIDLWLLFPIGVGVNRMLMRNGNIPQEWRERLDKLFGSSDWYDAFYAPTRTQSMFGDEPVEKTATFESITEYFQNRLRSVFTQVAPKPALLKNSKGNPLYALFFAVGNPKGANTAVKIANDILLKAINNG
jgi:three-Cys-motif partner protein